jgi:phosphate transport system substrate-binding protein
MQLNSVWNKRWAVTWALVSSLCGVSAHADVSLKGAGATFPSRVYERWVQRFADLNPGVNLNYSPTGSGDGVRQIKARAVHFGGTDNPLTPQQLAEAKLVQIPMLVGGLVPVVNVPGVSSNQLILSGEVLAGIMAGEITRWNDARIADLNPDVKLPSLAITRVVRSDASGSTEVFTRYLGESSPHFAQLVPAGQKPNWPGAVQSAKGNDGVSALVKATSGALGYVSFDRVIKDKLVGTRLRTPKGTVVTVSEDGFRSAILASDVYRKGEDTASLLNMPKSDAWPLTATSYVLVDAAPKDAVAAGWTARFVYWCFMHGDELTRGTGFAALPDRVQARLSGRLMQIHGPSGEVPKFQ